MAREFAPIRVDIWSDDDWRSLSPAAQHLYFLLLTAPSLSHCGVADWRPARIAALASPWSVDDVEDAATELIERLFILVDVSTEEVLVRSFVKHDGLMKQPKMAVSMSIAHAAVASSALRGVIVFELNKLKEKQPELHGWVPEKAAAILTKASVDPSTYPLGKGFTNGSVKGSVNPKAKGSVKGSPTPAPAPAPVSIHPSSANADGSSTASLRLSSADADGLFEKFWDAVPKKVGKKAARRRWDKAIKEKDPADLIAAMSIYSAAVANRDPQFVLNPETWLNQGRWDDEVVAPSGSSDDEVPLYWRRPQP